ncbi:50S ribosomal protein L15 [Geobacter sulfurreducens]|jgi:large subunit ribosomal protein L15|uniref:Large ribosomal subunit protein uL15 n=1 Tax=Geobacter sulfurreducens (strain ATCC 51573 / DSM 12127 / PCA) TaxID=243231 RepID=RL15_GEOSL|nr:50S ribosomal protein L15 [Geobacter sulfurreducens]Q749A6.1 RecName: Full=Large ribosomal subunit protein uL15; AltName: Full=50S ribosomal protein L15 [Geobacter sulfurreducens PCA]AAR36231.1 ribosomal protein L15 [Geobacter sulfurreducens PCA]ADI85592.1 ribosomal protein L15 [Geobacter sulfurreducens KN400]AJY69107.1 50S ribosomal protein L15 [Geobacter sulfurreducens]QVW34654.1 50S ribosomal protein L15 [Geobacter sulfurreducens]UAC03523.1 50S ribosomal protein L15 [Geobacter sulfurred
MELNELRPAVGATKDRKRIGRGPGSGHGKTATKGHKGQKARSGGSVKPGFEGGQMPMQRRLPKRGFTPLTRKEYALVNVGQLEVFEAGSCIDVEALLNAGLIGGVKDGLKVLADGDLTKPLTVKAHKFSAKAKEKIAAAGGTVEEISL